jgi:hypothetical protein
MRVSLVLGLLSAVSGMGLEGRANPIRKVVSLMQNMQKEIEAEGKKEKELFEKFMCFCSGSGGDMTKAAADTAAKIDELAAKLKGEEAEKSQITQELADHKKDREGATEDLQEATVLREKEANEYAETKADMETNIAAMGKAIPALEKGMGGAALIQAPKFGDQLKQIVLHYPNMDPTDRRQLSGFLELSEDYAPASGQIVGILKAMKDEMEADLKSATSEEEKAIAGYGQLKASKEKEVEMATEAIETKVGRKGELAVSVVQTKDSLEDSQKELADTEKFAQQLKQQCGTKEKEWAEREKLRSEEIAAVSEAIAIVNDDDALDVFKKALPSALVQDSVGFLQRSNTHASGARKAQAILADAVTKSQSSTMKLILFSLNSKLKGRGKTTNFAEVIKMIDEMVILLGKQQKDDEKHKEWCEDEFAKNEDETKAVKTKLGEVDAALSEMNDEIGQLMEEISTLTKEVSALDAAVAEATDQRKEEHQDYVELVNMNAAALGLMQKAKNRLQKFYNPTLYKAPPKTENTMEEKIIEAGTFAQVHEHSDVAPPPAPETFGEYEKKGEKSAGVIGMMDTIIKDLEDGTKEAEYEEKTGQKDYGELMADSQETRAQDVKSITDKESAKATLEDSLLTTRNQRKETAQDLKDAATYTQDLHTSCDFIMQNFDVRKTARSTEVEALKNAKAVLSGANFS